MCHLGRNFCDVVDEKWGDTVKVSNKLVVLVNYTSNRITEALEIMGNDGYKLVSAVMAKNIAEQDCMYLFFSKEEK